TGRSVSESRRRVFLSGAGSWTALGISVRMDEFVSGSACRDGHTGGWICTVHGILFPGSGNAVVHGADRASGIHVHGSAGVGGARRGAGNRDQLPERKDEWRHSGAADVIKGGDDCPHRIRRFTSWSP